MNSRMLSSSDCEWYSSLLNSQKVKIQNQATECANELWPQVMTFLENSTSFSKEKVCWKSYQDELRESFNRWIHESIIGSMAHCQDFQSTEQKNRFDTLLLKVSEMVIKSVQSLIAPRVSYKLILENLVPDDMAIDNFRRIRTDIHVRAVRCATGYTEILDGSDPVVQEWRQDSFNCLNQAYERMHPIFQELYANDYADSKQNLMFILGETDMMSDAVSMDAQRYAMIVKTTNAKDMEEKQWG